MAIIRQDAWTDSEDMMLAEVVLRHIREGSTQLSAFEEVGTRLQRSSAACGFRWNSLVRKKYSTAVELAKKQRKELKKKAPVKENVRKSRVIHHKKVTESNTSELTLEQIISYLRNLNVNQNLVEREEYEQLQQENENLKHQLNDLKNKYYSIQKDYQSLIEIMNRARQLVIVNEESNKVAYNESQELQKAKK
jgi:prespore-specific regulator